MQTRKLHPDRVGAWASGICAVHCLITGLALGLFSALGLGFLNSPLADVLLLTAAIGVGAFAVWHGIKRHRSYLPSIVFVLGIAMVLLGHFAFGHDHDAHEKSAWSVWLSVLGGLSLVGFHVLNWKLQHDRGCCHEAHCSHQEQ